MHGTRSTGAATMRGASKPSAQSPVARGCSTLSPSRSRASRASTTTSACRCYRERARRATTRRTRGTIRSRRRSTSVSPTRRVALPTCRCTRCATPSLRSRPCRPPIPGVRSSQGSGRTSDALRARSCEHLRHAHRTSTMGPGRVETICGLPILVGSRSAIATMPLRPLMWFCAGSKARARCRSCRRTDGAEGGAKIGAMLLAPSSLQALHRYRACASLASGYRQGREGSSRCVRARGSWSGSVPRPSRT